MKKLCLSNGLRLIIDQVPNSRSISIGVMIRVGTKHETKKTNGIAHFIEHLLFKNRIGSDNLYGNIYIEELGGKINAFTGKEFTCFYMHILNEYLNEALCILRDMVFSFSISNFDFENEKRVVIQEIYQYQDNTLEKVKIASLAHALGESSYAFDILGTVSNIESFTLTEVYEFYRKFYLSNNTVVSISGDVKEDMLHDIVKILENIGFGKTVDKKTQPIMFNGGINYIPIHSQEYQSHMCILFPAISSDVPMREYYTYYIMSHLFGVGRNSRLNKVLREERGLVYNIQSHPIVFEEVGLFRILASTGKENLWDVHSAIMEVIESVKEVGITLDEFNRSKRVLKSEIIFLTENTIQRMFFFGQEELLGIHKSSDVDKILETIDAIDVWEVENTLKGIFDDIYSLTVTIPPSASV